MLTAMIWKEYRQQMPMAVALLVFIVLLQISTYLLESSLSLYGGNSRFGFFAISLVVSMLYSSSAAAILYCNEHEEKTYTFLRALPIPRRILFGGKILWLSVGSLLFLCVASVESLLIGVVLAPGGSYVTASECVLAVLAALGAGVVAPICWGVFWSTILRVQLTSLLATFVSVSSAFWIVYAGFAGSFLSSAHRDENTFGPWISAVFILLTLGIGAIGLFHAYRWHEIWRDKRDKTAPWARFVFPAQAADARSSDTLEQTHPVNIRHEFSALFFHAIAQQRTLFRWMIGIGLCYVVTLMFFLGPNPFPYDTLAGLSVDILMPTVFIAAIITALVFCGSVFSADQPNRCAFLAERGISPRKIWWSRILAFGSVFFSFALVVCFILEYHYREPKYLLSTGVLSLLFAIVLFFSGVFVSMACRSRIISVVGTAVLTGAFYFWAAMMSIFFGYYSFSFPDFAPHCMDRLREFEPTLWKYSLFVLNSPLLWNAVPIFLGMIVASRIRTADWLRGRPMATWRKGRRAVPLLLFGPLAVICLAIPAFRIYSVPRIDYGYRLDASVETDGFRYDIENPSDPAVRWSDYALKAAPKAYRRHIDLVRAAFSDPKNANIALVQVDLEGSVVRNMRYCMLRASRTRSPFYRERIQRIQRDSRDRADFQTDLQAERITLARKIGENIVKTEISPDQVYFLDGLDEETLQELDETIEILIDLGKNRVPYSERLKRRYEVLYRFVRDGKPPFRYENEDYWGENGMQWWRRIPWEKARGLRLVSHDFQTYSLMSEQAENVILRRHGDLTELQNREEESDLRCQFVYHSGALFDNMLGNHISTFTFPFRTVGIYAKESARRATIIQLALLKYRKIHGVFPETLEELKTVGYLQEIPSVPYYEEPFYYDPAPDGTEPVVSHYQNGYRYSSSHLRNHIPGMPYLWNRNLDCPFSVPNPKGADGEIRWVGDHGTCFDITVFDPQTDTLRITEPNVPVPSEEASDSPEQTGTD